MADLRRWRAAALDRGAIAGFVAPDLAEWNYWDVVPEYMALLRSGPPLHPASRYAILDYIQRSPDAGAKLALKSLPVVPREFI